MILIGKEKTEEGKDRPERERERDLRFLTVMLSIYRITVGEELNWETFFTRHALTWIFKNPFQKRNRQSLHQYISWVPKWKRLRNCWQRLILQ